MTNEPTDDGSCRTATRVVGEVKLQFLSMEFGRFFRKGLKMFDSG